jgi:transcriptional regulator with XRE-family HTH domain
MEMAGLASYIRTLREGQGITRAWLAEQAGTTETSLYRIENGKQEPSGQLLLNLVAAVRGSYTDARNLLAGNGADEHTGRELAEKRLSQAEIAMIDSLIEDIGDEEAERLADQLVNDPEFRRSIIRAVVGSHGKRKR